MSMYEETEAMDMKINVGKIKVVVFDRENGCEDVVFIINSEAVDQVNDFMYLGRMFNRTGRIDSEIERLVERWLVACGRLQRKRS